MKKFVALVLTLLLTLSLFAGCGGQSAEPENGQDSTESYLTFTDSCGTEFTLEKPLEKVIVLNRQTAEAFKLLGAEDIVIATGDTTVANNPYLGFNDLPDMGDTDELNIESILSLAPDAVFVHTNRATELEEKLEEKTERWMYLTELKEKIDAQNG